MNRGGTEAQSQGFTIVETLIVLAVTGTLFTIAAITVNGRQNRTDFQVGSQLIAQQLQQVINEVQSGYYQTSSTEGCKISGSSLDFSDNNAQGSNDDCIFAGKTVVFNSAATANQAYSVYSLAGKRLNVTGDGGQDVSSPAEAKLTMIPNSNNPQKIQNGLTFYGGRYAGTDSWITARRFPVAFLSNLANFETNTNGSQRVEVRGYMNPSWASPAGAVSDEAAINNEIGDGDYGNVLENVELCFDSGGTSQSVIVTISGGAQVTFRIQGSQCS